MAFFKSIKGRALGLGATGNLVARGIDVTAPCVDATITVAAEITNVRAITIQLKDAMGNDIAYSEIVELFVFADVGKLATATGGSTGIAIGTDGNLQSTVVAKTHFVLTSEADGDIDLTWTDTGTESVALGLRLPTGRVVMTAAFANT